MAESASNYEAPAVNDATIYKYPVVERNDDGTMTVTLGTRGAAILEEVAEQYDVTLSDALHIVFLQWVACASREARSRGERRGLLPMSR